MSHTNSSVICSFLLPFSIAQFMATFVGLLEVLVCDRPVLVSGFVHHETNFSPHHFIIGNRVLPCYAPNFLTAASVETSIVLHICIVDLHITQACSAIDRTMECVEMKFLMKPLDHMWPSLKDTCNLA